jgi:hypothetical protein
MIGFIEHLHSPLGTTSSYGAIADIYILQITAHFKSSWPSLYVS